MTGNNPKVAAWRRAIALSALFVAASLVPDTTLCAQDLYSNRSNRIYPSRPASVPTQRSPIFSRPSNGRFAQRPESFRVELKDKPLASTQPVSPFSRSRSNLAISVFQDQEKVKPKPADDIFGENQQDDVFGENQNQEKPKQEQPPVDPFKTTDPGANQQRPAGDNRPDSMNQQEPVEKPPTSPFKEIPPVGGDQNPSQKLPQDPNPITPPMDTRPVKPTVPEEKETKEEPGSILVQPPLDQDDGSDSPKNQRPVVDDQATNPVPRSEKKRIYLPAKDPTFYAIPDQDVDPNNEPIAAFDPGLYPQNHPFATLPGPYGYAAPPVIYDQHAAGVYQPQACPTSAGCPPSKGRSSCGDVGNVFGHQSGCNQCASSAGVCSNCGIQSATGMVSNQCNTCSTEGISRRPMVTNRIEDIGDRFVETGTTEVDPDSYTDVVAHCDEICSNYTNCYLSAFGGLSDLNDLVTRDVGANGIYQEDSGYLFGIALGQVQGRNLRTELELSYRNIDINGLQLSNGSVTQNVGVFGDVGVFSGMLNGYWELVDFGPDKFNLYFGGGIGFAVGRIDLLQANGAEAAIDNDESSFAWQWMAGINYKTSSAMDAFVEYRYFAADSLRIDSELPTIAGLGNGSGPFDFRSGSVLFGVRARF